MPRPHSQNWNYWVKEDQCSEDFDIHCQVAFHQGPAKAVSYVGWEQSCVPHPPRPKAGTGVCPSLVDEQPTASHGCLSSHASDGTTTNRPCLLTGRLSLQVSGLCPSLVYLMADTSPCLLNRPFTQGYKSSLYLLKRFFFFFFGLDIFPLCVSIFALFFPPHT